MRISSHVEMQRVKKKVLQSCDFTFLCLQMQQLWALQWV